MTARQQWQADNDSNPMTMVTWLLIGPRESASIARGTSREHKVIATRACEGANIARGTPREHEAILDRETKGESEGSNLALPKVY